MGERIIFEILVPVLMCVVGWLTNAYRNKQKKEKDTLDNVKQIIGNAEQMLGMNKEFIADLKTQLDETKSELKRAREKTDHKVRAIKEAYDCEIDSSRCPVLIYDKKGSICDLCEHKKQNGRDD